MLLEIVSLNSKRLTSSVLCTGNHFSLCNGAPSSLIEFDDSKQWNMNYFTAKLTLVRLHISSFAKSFWVTFIFMFCFYRISAFYDFVQLLIPLKQKNCQTFSLCSTYYHWTHVITWCTLFVSHFFIAHKTEFYRQFKFICNRFWATLSTFPCQMWRDLQRFLWPMNIKWSFVSNEHLCSYETNGL